MASQEEGQRVRGSEGGAAAYQALVRATARLGYPEEFAYVMACELRSESAMRQMAAYLSSARPGGPEEIADELLAIVQVRDAWVEQKASERSNATLTAWYNRPDRADPIDGDDGEEG